MANSSLDVNPQDKEDKVSDYTRDSKGFISSLEAVATGIKGATKVVSDAINVADEYFLNRSKEDAKDAISQVNTEYGVDAAVVVNAGIHGNYTPAEIDKAYKQLRTMRGAVDVGAFSENNYLSQLILKTKQLKMKYPGYTDHIDKVVEDITGMKPANALVRNMLRDAAGTKNNEQQEYDHYERKAADLGIVSVAQRKADGNPMSRMELQYAVTLAENKKAKDAQLLQEIQLEEKAGEQREKKATKAWNQIVYSTFATNGPLAMGHQQLQKKIEEGIAKGKAGVVMSADEQVQLRAMLADQKAKFNAELSATWTRPFPNDKEGNSFATTIQDKTQFQKTKDTINSMFDHLEQSVLNEKWGLVAYPSLLFDAMKTGDQLSFAQTDEKWRKFMAIKSSLGPDVLNNHLMTNPMNLKDMDRIIETTKLGESIAGLSTGGIGKQIQEAKEEAQDPKSRAPASIVKRHADILADPKTGDKEFNNAAANVFTGPVKGDINNHEFWTHIPYDKRAETLASYMSPSVIARMEKMKSSNPEKYANWVNFVTTSAGQLYQKEMNDINAIRINRENYDVDYDPKAMKFTLKRVDAKNTRSGSLFGPDPNSPEPGGLLSVQQGVIDIVDYMATLNTQTAFNNMESLLKSMSAIWKAEGKNPEEESIRFLDAVGSNLRTAKKPENSMLDTVFNKLNVKVAGLLKLLPEPQTAKESQVRSNAVNVDEARGYQGEDIGQAQELTEEQADEMIYNKSGWQATVYQSLQEDNGQTIQETIRNSSVAPLLDTIATGESSGRYDMTLKGPMPMLTGLTIAQVYEAQAGLKKGGAESTAVGRYQFVNKTLKRIVDKLGLDPETTIFNEATQDALALELLRERGLDKYNKGEITEKQFADNLAKEWAAVPLESGKSYYDGVGSNKARINRKKILDTIRSLRAGKTQLQGSEEEDRIEAGSFKHVSEDVAKVIGPHASKAADNAMELLNKAGDLVGLSEVQNALNAYYKGQPLTGSANAIMAVLSLVPGSKAGPALAKSAAKLTAVEGGAMVEERYMKEFATFSDAKLRSTIKDLNVEIDGLGSAASEQVIDAWTRMSAATKELAARGIPLNRPMEELIAEAEKRALGGAVKMNDQTNWYAVAKDLGIEVPPETATLIFNNPTIRALLEAALRGREKGIGDPSYANNLTALQEAVGSRVKRMMKK